MQLNLFKSQIENLMREFEGEDAPENHNIPSGVLYHYRKFDHAIGIIKNKKLWYSNYKNLEDKEELKFGHEVIEEVIKNNFLLHNANSKEILHYFSNMINHQSVYTLSLSTHGNDENFWKEDYSDQGTGIALGFKFPIKNAIYENWNNKYSLKVFYENDIDIFRCRINKLINLLHDYDFQKNEKFDAIERLIVPLLAYMPALKRNRFSWENEYRIVIPGLLDKGGIRYPCSIPMEHFNKKTGHLLCPFDSNELKEVTTGPNSEKNIRQEIEQALVDSGHDLNQIKFTPE